MEMNTERHTALIDGRTYEVGSPAFVAALDARTARRSENGRRFLANWCERHGADYPTLTVADMAQAEGWTDLS